MNLYLGTKHGNIDIYTSKNAVISEIAKSISELKIISANIDETSDSEMLEYYILKYNMVMAGCGRLIKKAKEEGLEADIPPLYLFCRR